VVRRVEVELGPERHDAGRIDVGLCAAVFGVAWLADVGWLMGLAAIVVGEETLESSVHIAALRDGCARARREAAAGALSPARASSAA
jgi:hypothetical protein